MTYIATCANIIRKALTTLYAVKSPINRLSESIAKIQSYLLIGKNFVRKSIAININERFYSFISILWRTARNGELGQPSSLLVQY